VIDASDTVRQAVTGLQGSSGRIEVETVGAGNAREHVGAQGLPLRPQYQLANSPRCFRMPMSTLIQRGIAAGANLPSKIVTGPRLSVQP